MFDLLLNTFLKNIHFSPGNSWTYLPSLLGAILLGVSLLFTAGFALKDLRINLPPVFTFHSIRSDKGRGPLEFVGVKELWNGKIVLIPATTTKDHAPQTAGKETDLRQQFFLNVSYSDAKSSVKIISDTLDACVFVTKVKKKPIKILVEPLNNDKIRLLVSFWMAGVDSKERLALIKSAIMLDIMNRLSVAAIKFEG